MLRDSDFDLFVELVRRAECSTQPPSEARPGATLRAERKSDDRLHRNELTRLKRSLKIAYVAGDIPESPHRLLDAIVQDSSPEVRSYRPLTHSEAWLDALRWAISHPQPSVPDYLPHQGQDRQFVVGEACKELRRRGYRVDIGAGGPQLGDDTRTEIARSIDSLIADIGGVDAICRLCGIISQHGKVHDGMWLLGNLPCRPDQPPIPWVPVGWLLSIALRHIRREPSTDDPGRAWNAALQLAIAFAASMDCQRYNQFDGVFLEAPDFVSTLAESLAWRELFTLPQVPRPFFVLTLVASWAAGAMVWSARHVSGRQDALRAGLLNGRGRVWVWRGTRRAWLGRTRAIAGSAGRRFRGHLGVAGSRRWRTACSGHRA